MFEQKDPWHFSCNWFSTKAPLPPLGAACANIYSIHILFLSLSLCWSACPSVPLSLILTLKYVSIWSILTSVTRLGNLLAFGQLLKPLATINFPKSLTFLGNFCKGVKIYHFSSEIVLGNFFRLLAIFFLSHWSWHSPFCTVNAQTVPFLSPSCSIRYSNLYFCLSPVVDVRLVSCWFKCIVLTLTCTFSLRSRFCSLYVSLSPSCLYTLLSL